MILKADKNKIRQKRHLRVRTHIHGTAERPRLTVYNDHANIYVKLIDDDKQVTFSAATSPVKFFKESGDIIEGAKIVGTAIAKNALDAGITEVVFDRGGCIFHGYAAVLAKAAREAGLKF